MIGFGGSLEDPISPIAVIFDRAGALTESMHEQLGLALAHAERDLRVRELLWTWTRIEVSLADDRVRSSSGTIHSNGDFERAIVTREYRWNEEDGAGYTSWVRT